MTHNFSGTTFTRRGLRRFRIECAKAHSDVKYIASNSDQWGRDFGHRSWLEGSEEGIQKALTVLSEKFYRIPGSPTSLGYFDSLENTPKIKCKEALMKGASMLQERLYLSTKKWNLLANGEAVFIGEQLFIEQDSPKENGPAKAVAWVRCSPDGETIITMKKANDEGWSEEIQDRISSLV